MCLCLLYAEDAKFYAFVSLKHVLLIFSIPMNMIKVVRLRDTAIFIYYKSHLFKKWIQFSNDKRHNLGVFRKHGQKEYGKVWEMKSTPILNILAL